MEYSIEAFVTIEAASKAEAVRRMAEAEDLIDGALRMVEGVTFATESTAPDYGVENAY